MRRQRSQFALCTALLSVTACCSMWFACRHGYCGLMQEQGTSPAAAVVRLETASALQHRTTIRRNAPSHGVKRTLETPSGCHPTAILRPSTFMEWWRVSPSEHPTPASVSPAGWHAQDAEDFFAWMNFFFGRQGLTVVESGAFTGERYSASASLERALNWRAVLIEASQLHYKRLFYERPEALDVHVALCATPRDVHLTTAGNAADGVYEFMSRDTLVHYHPSLLDNASAVAALPTMRCDTITSVLASLCVQHVDFWILDVEGGELAVLQGANFSAVTVDVLCVEADGARPEKDAGVINLLRSAGYIYDGHAVRNDWFHHKSFTPKRGHGVAPRNITSAGGETRSLPPGLSPQWMGYLATSEGQIYYHRPDPWKLSWELPGT